MSGLAGSAHNWYENHENIFPAHHHAALLMDLLYGQEIDSHRFLSGSGIFIEDVIAQRSVLSVRQILKFTDNAKTLYRSPELAFRWGQLLWPGHFSCFSELLASSPDLLHFLEDLYRYRKILCPFLSPQLIVSNDYCCIEWRDVAGLGDMKPFFVAAYSTALVAATSQLMQQELPWLHSFNQPVDGADAAYRAYLGPNLYFGWGVDVTMIDRAYLQIPWANGRSQASITRQAALSQCIGEYPAPENSFLESVHVYLLENIQRPVTQQQCAEALGVSSATLKRKLKSHQTSFQKQHDLMRMQTSFRKFFFEGKSTDDVARSLAFNDTTNFRRAFKRWCGLTPSSSRALYASVQL